MKWTRTPPTTENVGEFWVASDAKESFAGFVKKYGNGIYIDNGINQYDTFALTYMGYMQFIGPLPAIKDVRETAEGE